MFGLYRRIALGLVLAVVCCASASAAQSVALRVGQGSFAGELVVPVNKSHVVEVDTPFKRISVGNSDVADIMPLTSRSFYVLGRKLGVTNLTLFDSHERVITVIDVTVTYDITGLKTRLSELFANDEVEVRATADGIVLSGAVAGGSRVNQIAKLAESYAPGKVTNLMSANGSQQVMLAVRFVEVNRQVGRAFGLKANVQDNGTFKFTTFDPLSVIDALATSFGVASGSFGVGEFNVDMLLQALETKGAARSLAEPNLIALSGDTASFLAGGEFPIPVAQSVTSDGGSGSSAITVEFKQFGVGLSFTPTVLDESRINLVVKPEVSSIDDTTAPVEVSGFTIPGLKTNRVETTIELRDGQSFAIAGLYKDSYRNTISQLPWIGDVPVLGALFRSSDFLSQQTELVVICTAYLVKPSVMANLSTPADRFITPSDLDLFIGGRTEGDGLPVFDGSASAAAKASNALKTADKPGGLAGAHGYILD